MSSITRIDQAVLLLRDRLKRLNERASPARSSQAHPTGRSDPLVSLRQLVQQGGIAPDELRKGLVRTLLADSLGQELADSLEFQSISDQVLRILEGSDAGRALVEKALSELE